jgi:hypothetical protein
MKRAILLLALLTSSTALADDEYARTWQRDFAVDAGASYHELFGVPYGTASVRLRYGGSYRHFGFFGEASAEAGAALVRLPIEQLQVGVGFEYIAGRVRFGAGIRTGALYVQRATTGDTETAFTMTPFFMISADVFRWDRHALYLGIEAGPQFVVFPGSNGDIDVSSPEVTMRLGVRF